MDATPAGNKDELSMKGLANALPSEKKGTFRFKLFSFARTVFERHSSNAYNRLILYNR
jgi:hypothetical protein